MAFDYIIKVTGDCQNNSSGVIDLFITGGSSPYVVQWVQPVLNTDIITSAVTKTNLASNTYTVQITDSSLPVNQVEFINIPVSSGVCCSILGVQGTTCSQNNGSVTGTSTTQYSSTNYYLYHGNGVFSQSATTNQGTVEFGSLTAGTYYMTVEDLGGCTGRSQNFIVEESEPLNYGLYMVPNSSCGGTPIGKLSVTGLTGQPPFSYLWNNGQTGSTITGLTSGPYFVTVTDGYGCELSKSENVVDVTPVGIVLFTATPPTCFAADGSITLTITGGTAPYYYSASTGQVEISYSQSFSISGLSSGSYEFLVTDAGFCQVFGQTSIVSPNGIASVSIQTSNSTCSKNDGEITISVIGGVIPYTYTIVYPNGDINNVSGNQTAQVFSNLSGGTYSIGVSDSSGCSYIDELLIITEDKYLLTTTTTGTTCNQSNGLIGVSVNSGATLPLNYSIDNGTFDILNTNLTAVTFNNIAAGTHTVTVTDATGCVQSTNVLITGSVPLDFTLYSSSCGIGNNGKLTAFINSGEPPFNFYWSDNVPGNPQQIQVSGLTGGTYSLTIVDNNGCSLTRNASITCFGNLSSYQTYVMGSEIFNITAPTKFGLLQMLNEGFYDLTLGNERCNLVSATFTVKVSVTPLGLTTSQTFFTTTSLNNVPADNQYYNVVRDLLLSVPGVGGVTINPLTNQITIETTRGDDTLNGQELSIDLMIDYDIMCLS
jgi:large repetitive protein